MLDPSADNTDVYAFVVSHASSGNTAVSNWIPLQDPADGPYFGKLDPAAGFDVKIYDTGEGVEDVAYRWGFVAELSRGMASNGVPAQVTLASSPDLNFVQSYDLYYGVGLDLGQGSVPNITSTIADASSLSRGVTAFAGPRDEPFFVDLGLGLN